MPCTLNYSISNFFFYIYIYIYIINATRSLNYYIYDYLLVKQKPMLRVYLNTVYFAKN